LLYNGFVQNPTEWGWFGLFENMDENPVNSPKFRAIRNRILKPKETSL